MSDVMGPARPRLVGLAVLAERAVDGRGLADLGEGLRRGLRGADPSVLPVLAATTLILGATPGQRLPDGDRVGLVQFGDAHPRKTAEAVRRGVADKGRVSPSDFINANAGAAVSTCCTRLGLMGPTMTLTMAGPTAAWVAERLAQGWLLRRHADRVVVVEATLGEDGEVTARARLFAREGPDEGAARPLEARRPDATHPS